MTEDIGPPEHAQPKILYVITKANFGGAQRYVLDLALSAREKDWSVEVVYGEDGLLREKLEEAHISTFRIPSLGRDVRAFADIRAGINLWKKFRATRPDVVHLNSSKVGALGALAARMAGVPNIIFTAHGWASTEDRPDWQKIIITMVHFATIVLAHRTIAVSHHTKREMSHLPFASRKMTVVHNAQHATQLKSKKDARSTIAADIPQLNHYTIWVGTGTELHPNKGIDVAIRGFAEVAPQFPDTALVVIGEGEERGRLQELIESLGMVDKIFLVGFIRDAGSILKAFDVFMLPSRKEGFPYSILEAGLAGIPLIASAVGGIPEAIKDMETGILIHPKSSTEVSRALSSLLEHREKRERMGQAFKADIATRFSFDKMCTETFALYHL